MKFPRAWLSPDGSLLFCGDRLVRLPGGEEIPATWPEVVIGATFLPDGQGLCLSTRAGLECYRLDGSRVESPPPDGVSWPDSNNPLLSPDGLFLVYPALYCPLILVWAMDLTEARMLHWNPPMGVLLDYQFTPDSEGVVGLARRGNPGELTYHLEYWSVGTPALSSFALDGDIVAAALVPEDNRCLAIERDGRAVLWEPATSPGQWRCAGSWPEVARDVPECQELGVSRDGRLLLVRRLEGKDSRLGVWVVGRGEGPSDLPVRGELLAFALRGDGSLVATLSLESPGPQLLTLWSLSGRPLAEAPVSPGHPFYFSGFPPRLQFSPDGRWVAHSTADRVEVWDVESLLA